MAVESTVHHRNEQGVKIGAPDLGKLPEGVGVGLHAPAFGKEGIADLPNGCFRGEGDDHHKYEGDDTGQREQAQNHMEQGFRARADGV